ncbi:Hypothetical predicted protein, partial [Mytilus galloprovincialis]
IRMTKSEYKVNYGATILLECVLIGNPNLKSVCWYKETPNETAKSIITNGSKYKGSTVNNPSLVILSVNENDNGTYFCTAKVDDRELRGDTVSVGVQGM